MTIYGRDGHHVTKVYKFMSSVPKEASDEIVPCLAERFLRRSLKVMAISTLKDFKNAKNENF